MKNSHFRGVAMLLFLFSLLGVQAASFGLSCCPSGATTAQFAPLTAGCNISAAGRENAADGTFLAESGRADDHHECECHHLPSPPDHQRSSLTQTSPQQKAASLSAIIPTFHLQALRRHFLSDCALSRLNRNNLPPLQSLAALHTIVIRC